MMIRLLIKRRRVGDGGGKGKRERGIEEWWWWCEAGEVGVLTAASSAVYLCTDWLVYK